MIATKSYEVLTDPSKKVNEKKYRNIDGEKYLQVSIGLITFLFDIENFNLVLLVYLIFMVGVIPFYAWSHYSDLSKF